MRYFLTGLSLFFLLAIFVRSWYVQRIEEPATQIIVLEKQSPKELGVVYSSFFILKDNLLLRPADYQVIEEVMEVLKQKPNTKLIVSLSEALNAPKVKGTLSTIFDDQGLNETRFQFLRKPSKTIGLHKVLFQVL